jgi:hypothetical protein
MHFLLFIIKTAGIYLSFKVEWLYVYNEYWLIYQITVRVLNKEHIFRY